MRLVRQSFSFSEIPKRDPPLLGHSAGVRNRREPQRNPSYDTKCSGAGQAGGEEIPSSVHPDAATHQPRCMDAVVWKNKRSCSVETASSSSAYFDSVSGCKRMHQLVNQANANAV